MSRPVEKFTRLDNYTIRECEEYVNFFTNNRDVNFSTLNLSNFRILYLGINLYKENYKNCWNRVANFESQKSKNAQLKNLIETIYNDKEIYVFLQNLFTYIETSRKKILIDSEPLKIRGTNQDQWEYKFIIQNKERMKQLLISFAQKLGMRVNTDEIIAHLTNNVYDDFTNLNERGRSVGVIIKKDIGVEEKKIEQFLLVKNKLWEDYKENEGKFSFPKGGVKKYFIDGSEISEYPFDTASRELFEETSIFIHPKILKQCDIFKGNFNNLYYIYDIDSSFNLPEHNGKILINPFQNEIIEIKWFDRREIQRENKGKFNADVRSFFNI